MVDFWSTYPAGARTRVASSCFSYPQLSVLKIRSYLLSYVMADASSAFDETSQASLLQIHQI